MTILAGLPKAFPASLLIVEHVAAGFVRGLRRVAIDDFGTGYSSLSRSAKLPVGTLKSDQAFIINMISNSDDLSIVSAIFLLAHSMNMRVIVEGVGTGEHANHLRLLKCDEIQGFLFSPVVPAAQIEEFPGHGKSLLFT